MPAHCGRQSEGRTVNALQRISAAVSLAVLVSAASSSFAANTVMVGGAAMYPTKTIVENAINSKDHTTLVAAVKAAGLVDTLNGAGPFTVFAPTNAAFDKLPAGTVDTLVKPENKAQLTKILTYHVVPGTYTSAQLVADARKHGGKATLKTVQGEPLTISLHEGKLWVIDAKGGKAGISIADVGQSNGVIHVIDTVLMPK
ncbi:MULTISPECIES: fasciclin domain-containing protein [Stenotrophomonas]|uniref:fasciclin domain-containing protein n=1 Tax=Stenotrophomonas maltophilia TaxID=40324 RepID=UPI0018DEEEA8|nr:fasciclin domain-containing protein [Stenotrophomonas maltophilia]